jgi:hypothetical protein
MNAKLLFACDFGSLVVLLIGISAVSFLALNGF